MNDYTWLLSTSTRRLYYRGTCFTTTSVMEQTTWSWRTTAMHYVTWQSSLHLQSSSQGLHTTTSSRWWHHTSTANHLIDTTVVSGPDYIDTSLWRTCTTGTTTRLMEFLQKVKPDYIHVVQEDDTTEETTTGATSSSKKKGVRTTTITSDYDMEIVVKHVKRAWLPSLRQGEHYKGEWDKQPTGSLLRRECYYPWPDHCLRLEDTTTA